MIEIVPKRAVGWRLHIRSLLAAALLVPTAHNSALADSFCGPGRKLGSENDGPGMSWKCLPERGQQRRASSTVTTGGNRAAAGVAAGLAVGSVVLSIVQSLASQSRMTDNLGSVDLDKMRHGTASRDHNRRGLTLQQAGKFSEARVAFLKASREAIYAGNVNEAKVNERNADIADALHWLRKGFTAEQSGKKTSANIAYRMGIDAARRAGDEAAARRLVEANDSLVGSNPGQSMYQSKDQSCATINGKYACY